MSYVFENPERLSTQATTTACKRKPRVIIIAGSLADKDHFEAIAQATRALGIETMIRLSSAHKTPDHALHLLREYEQENRPTVYITVAGRSNALSGFVDGGVLSPVIACPPPALAWSAVDIFSSLRMPSGVAPAVVLEPQNAALLAAKMLGLVDQPIREQIEAYQQAGRRKLQSADEGYCPPSKE